MRSIVVGGLIGATLLAGCGDDIQVTTMLWYRAPCVAQFLRMCSFERLPDGTEHIVYDGLPGYEPTWGVEVDLAYQLDHSDDDDQDAVPVRRVVDIVATRTVPVGTSTRWYQRPRESWFTAAGDGVEVLGTAVACEPALCAELTMVPMTTNRAIDVAYTGDAAVPLRALAISTP